MEKQESNYFGNSQDAMKRAADLMLSPEMANAPLLTKPSETLLQETWPEREKKD